jgi:tetratricopeptide (TPR) repeat protein
LSGQPFQGITWSFGANSSDPTLSAAHQLQEAETLRQQLQFDRAKALCEPLVARYPDYFGALQTLGLIYADKRQYPQALGFLVRAVMLNPRSWQALTSLSAVYLELGATELAAQTLEQARDVNPLEAGIFATLGQVYRAEREYELAYDAYRRALELDSTLTIASLGLGMCCMHLARYEEAAACFTQLIKRGKRSLVAMTALALLPTALVKVDVLDELTKLEVDKELKKQAFENSVELIRAAALDRAGKHQEAWQCMVRANQRIYPEREKDMREVTETEQASLLRLQSQQIQIASADGSKPISLFILGPSRSGKTTMEALIATLPAVKRGYENPIVENAVRRTFQSAGLLAQRAFDSLPPTLNTMCREIYLDELSRRAGMAKVFTNTHPVRIHDAARLAATIPNVRFVLLRRNLEDNALRIFMREYAVGNSYSYDLAATRAHLDWYNRMIDLLIAKLPKITCVVAFEDLICDPAAALKAVAELCGVSADHGPLPTIGDDRGCAAPYRSWIDAAFY